jgi:hypothetical protein
LYSHPSLKHLFITIPRICGIFSSLL